MESAQAVLAAIDAAIEIDDPLDLKAQSPCLFAEKKLLRYGDGIIMGDDGETAHAFLSDEGGHEVGLQRIAVSQPGLVGVTKT